ncbi:MAG: peroxiredoxin [Meiothermus sp.]
MERPLQPGTRLPKVTLFDPELKPVVLSELARGQTTALNFFPAAFSKSCTSELCAFRDSLGDYAASGAEVVGIPTDSPFTLKMFAQSLGLGYPLFSDYNREAIRAFGVVQPEYQGLRELPRRSTFVVDSLGTVHYAWVSDAAHLEPPYAQLQKAVVKLVKEG